MSDVCCDSIHKPLYSSKVRASGRNLRMQQGTSASNIPGNVESRRTLTKFLCSIQHSLMSQVAGQVVISLPPL